MWILPCEVEFPQKTGKVQRRLDLPLTQEKRRGRRQKMGRRVGIVDQTGSVSPLKSSFCNLLHFSTLCHGEYAEVKGQCPGVWAPLPPRVFQRHQIQMVRFGSKCLSPTCHPVCPIFTIFSKLLLKKRELEVTKPLLIFFNSESYSFHKHYNHFLHILKVFPCNINTYSFYANSF